ncbi:MAG: hypothetical protein GY737_29640 [Desulfobacteraceae bacterium]|nr:hypothetical protein [Desulfobacteraceae bacterium]
MSNASSVVPVTVETAPEAAKDPLERMIEIAENDKLSDQDKNTLIKYSRERFVNRRRMAYLALYTLILSLAALFIAAFIDGFTTCPEGRTCTGVLQSIKESQTLFIWIEGFLAAIVGAYFGVSAWRPAS